MIDQSLWCAHDSGAVRHYAVVYVPSGESGKFWLAPGTVENFGFADFFTFGDVVQRARAFHEIEPALVPCVVPLVGIIGVAYLGLHVARDRSVLIPPIEDE